MKALLLALLAAPAFAQTPVEDAQKVRSAELKVHYDAAFELYSKGDYSRAIMEWREVLRKAPDQSTAEKMISMAREAIDRRDHSLQEAVYDRAAEGKYQDAMIALQKLLESDALHPHYTLLQARLDRLTFVVPTVSTDSKAWQAAVRGMTGYIAPKDDLGLAYDGLRLAKELDGKEPLFDRLIAILLSDNPALAADALTPGMGVLEHKRYLALNHIYDGHYNLAIPLLERVLQLDPDDAVALKRLGSAHFALKDKAKAKEYWTRALTLKPDDAQLKVFLTGVQQ
ncbi:tetratricopeptide repeat protein [bacterium]|nr:MAG: tetratricopeptide repeat protein [bacterium]